MAPSSSIWTFDPLQTKNDLGDRVIDALKEPAESLILFSGEWITGSHTGTDPIDLAITYTIQFIRSFLTASEGTTRA